MLRIAVPNKGSLSETAADMLAEAGYAGRRDPKTLHVVDADNDVEFSHSGRRWSNGSRRPAPYRSTCT